MVSDALQIYYNQQDYDLYKSWTKGNRVRQLGFMFALFKVKSDNHIQAVFSGEFGQGKSSAAIQTARWDTIFTRRLLRVYKPNEFTKKGDIHFGVKDNIIISPEDPASKYIKDPKRYNAYEIDEGYLFATTGEANALSTKGLRKQIMKNRKKNISNYWVYPNIFKMPTILLELMDIWVHKENICVGDVIIPNRVIQNKEKFNRDKIEKMAEYPKGFANAIKHHPSFVTKVRFSKIKGKSWKAYLKKYDDYVDTDEEADKVKVDVKLNLFNQIHDLVEKGVVDTGSAKARQEFVNDLMYNTIREQSSNEIASKQMADSMTQQYLKWEEDKVARQLTKSLSKSLMKNAKINIDLGLKEDEEEAS